MRATAMARTIGVVATNSTADAISAPEAYSRALSGASRSGSAARIARRTVSASYRSSGKRFGISRFRRTW